VARIIRPIFVFVAACLAAAGLAACGGGTSGEVVAQVGGSPITKAEVNHWMSTLAGGDFYEISKQHALPAGLVSEPPNYGACVTHLETIAASSDTVKPKPTAPQLLSKCRQLYQALRLQALNYLVDSQWTIGLAGEEGLKASNGEAMQLLKEIKAEQFPKEREFQRYLANNRRSLADEMFVMKLNVLQRKIQQKLSAGGSQALAQFTEAGQRWTAKTSCNAGYVVQHCKQYTGQQPAAASSLPSPAVLLERVAVITGRPCVNHLACD
jgi:hypothetical protein